MKINEVIKKIIIKSNAQGVDSEKTIDQIIIGNPNQEVKGIVTTFMATIDVIKEAVDKNCNLIITHEPTWYNGRDREEWLKKDNVYESKKNLLLENDIVVWRFHDYMHHAQEDLIYKGFEQLIDWQDYKLDGNHDSKNPLEKTDLVYEIPSTDVKSILKQLQDKLKIPAIRYIGSLDKPVKRIGLLLGGSSLGLGDETNPIQLIHNQDLDMVICGDIFEWTIPAYVRDAKMQGLDLSMIVIGHNRSEEEGMKYVASWIESFVSNVPIEFIESGDPFEFYS